jgi:thioredoxin 1
MKTTRLAAVFSIVLFAGPALFVQASPQKTREKKSSAAASSFLFEPLDNWKAAVLSGDKSALAKFYSTFPAATAKTPQGDIQDPAEEPAFWSSLRAQGLDGMNVKVLEAKKVQPGVMALVMHVDVNLKTGGGEKEGVVSAAQVWMQKLGEWKIITTQRGDLAAKPVRRLPEPARPNTQLYPPPEEAQAEISSALAAAGKDHKRVILVFGGNWCYDCHVLDSTFRSRDFAPLVNANYRVIHINIGNYDANLDLAKKYEIPLEKGVPSLAILDPDGKLVVSQKKGEFESTVRIGPEDVLEFLKKWKPQHGS